MRIGKVVYVFGARRLTGAMTIAGRAFTTWTAGAARAAVVSNHVRRYLGTKQRDARLEQALIVELDNTSGVLQRDIASPVSTPSRHVAKREALVILANALKQLPEDYRQVIILRHLEGLPFTDVAARMGRTVPSVQNLWVRALAKMKQNVGESL